MGRIITDIVGRQPTSVTTFYNGGCPVCSREISRYRNCGAVRGRELLWRDLNDCPSALRCFGVGREEAMRRLHVVDRAGVLQTGVDAFITIWRELPGYRWLAVVVSLPGVHGLAGLAYDRLLAPVLDIWTHRHPTQAGKESLGGHYG